jgi:hypothetical protein
MPSAADTAAAAKAALEAHAPDPEEEDHHHHDGERPRPPCPACAAAGPPHLDAAEDDLLHAFDVIVAENSCVVRSLGIAFNIASISASKSMLSRRSASSRTRCFRARSEKPWRGERETGVEGGWDAS